MQIKKKMPNLIKLARLIEYGFVKKIKFECTYQNFTATNLQTFNLGSVQDFKYLSLDWFYLGVRQRLHSNCYQLTEAVNIILDSHRSSADINWRTATKFCLIYFYFCITFITSLSLFRLGGRSLFCQIHFLWRFNAGITSLVERALKR